MDSWHVLAWIAVGAVGGAAASYTLLRDKAEERYQEGLRHGRARERLARAADYALPERRRN